MADTKTCNIVNEKLKKVEETAKKWLGKTTDYNQEYSPDILLPFSRQDSLESCDINPNEYMWYGFDLWNLWELRYKLQNNRSIQRVGTLVYDARSPQIIESKSMKLYFFAMDEEKFEGKDQTETDLKYVNRATLDLTNKTGTIVDFSIFSQKEYLSNVQIDAVSEVNEYQSSDTTIILDDLIIKDTFVDAPNDGEVNYDNPDLIKVDSTKNEIEKVNVIDYLYYAGQSRCLVTGQKDTCTEFIRIEMSNKFKVNPESLVKYLQQFESVNRFHESTAHTIFDRLVKKVRKFDPTANVTVWSLYTRRGGIDINPFRTTNVGLYDYLKTTIKNRPWSKTWNQ